MCEYVGHSTDDVSSLPLSLSFFASHRSRRYNFDFCDTPLFSFVGFFFHFKVSYSLLLFIGKKVQSLLSALNYLLFLFLLAYFLLHKETANFRCFHAMREVRMCTKMWKRAKEMDVPLKSR